MTGNGSGIGSANSSFDGQSQNYPGVPYNTTDFHGHHDCPTPDLNIWVSSHFLRRLVDVVFSSLGNKNMLIKIASK